MKCKAPFKSIVIFEDDVQPVNWQSHGLNFFNTVHFTLLHGSTSFTVLAARVTTHH